MDNPTGRLRGQELHQPARERIYREIRDSAQQIICRKGATYYGIAMAVGRIAACIVRDEHAVLPILSQQLLQPASVQHCAGADDPLPWITRQRLGRVGEHCWRGSMAWIGWP